MKDNLLVKYSINNINYYIYLYNNKFYYDKKNSKNESLDISPSDKADIKEVIKFIIGNTNSYIKLNNVVYNNKSYLNYYNLSNNIFYINNSVLSYIINNEEMLSYNNINNNKDNIFKKIFKINGKVIALFISSVTLFSLFTYLMSNRSISIDKVLNEPIYNIKEIHKANHTIVSDTDIDYLINNNFYINNKEREFIRKLKNEVIENKDYIDNDNLNRLNSLNIIYGGSEKYKEGSYDHYRNEIVIYNATNYDNANKSVLAHEINHVISNKNSQVLNEVFNEIFANEYLSNGKVSGYETLVPIGYSLSKIIPLEYIRDYKFNGVFTVEGKSNSLVGDSISLYLNSIGLDIKDMAEFNKLLSLHKSFNYSLNEYNIDEVNKVNEEIYSLIKKMYSLRYNKDIKDDIELMFLLKDFSSEAISITSNIIKDMFNISDNYELIVKPKGTFSKEYIESNSKTNIFIKNIIEDKEEIYNITIDDIYMFYNNKELRRFK